MASQGIRMRSPLGKLTAEVLNITQEYEQMMEYLEQAEKERSCYCDTQDVSHWKTANDCYLKLDAMLCTRKLFQLLLSDLEELRTHDFTLTADDDKVLNQINLYEEYLPHLAPGIY